jgi:hypothetical protein
MVRYLTTNGKSKGYATPSPFALRYRRVNRTFYEAVRFEGTEFENSSAAPCSSPEFFRVCGEYRRKNSLSTKIKPPGVWEIDTY